jgi:lipopolysaccharide export system permease protein
MAPQPDNLVTMRLLSRHILRSLAAPFFWGLLALTGLLLLNQLANLIDRFGGRGLGFDIMIEAVVLALPALLTLTIPMAVLVASLYAFTTLAADLELVAMYANGVSVWRMVRPGLAAVIFIGAINFLLFDQVVPLSNTRFRTLQADVTRKTPTVALRPQQLNEFPPTGYLLRAETIADSGGRMQQVTIWDLRQYASRRVIHADSGVMSQSPNGIDLLLTLFDGELLDFNIQQPAQIERTQFAINQIRLRDVANQLERSSSQAERGDREKSGCELLDDIDIFRWQYEDAQRQRELMTRRDLRHLAGLPPLPPPPVQTRPTPEPNCGSYRGVEKFLKRVLIPSPLGAQEPVQLRRPPQDSVKRPVITDTSVVDSLQDSQPLVPLVPQESLPLFSESFLVPPMSPAPPRTDGLATTMVEVTGAQIQAREALRMLREYAVEYHKKFAIPLASFCFVLVGMALAIKYPRGGIGLVIGGSLLIFLTFYILLIGGEGLANQGVVSAPVAMYGPVLVFTAAGLAAVASANREMGSTRGGTALFDRIKDLFRKRRAQ